MQQETAKQTEYVCCCFLQLTKCLKNHSRSCLYLWLALTVMKFHLCSTESVFCEIFLQMILHPHAQLPLSTVTQLLNAEGNLGYSFWMPTHAVTLYLMSRGRRFCTSSWVGPCSATDHTNQQGGRCSQTQQITIVQLYWSYLDNVHRRSATVQWSSGVFPQSTSNGHLQQTSMLAQREVCSYQLGQSVQQERLCQWRPSGQHCLCLVF